MASTVILCVLGGFFSQVGGNFEGSSKAMESHCMKICIPEFGDICKRVETELHLQQPIKASVCMDGDVALHNLLDDNIAAGGWVAARVDDLNHNAKNVYKKINGSMTGSLNFFCAFLCFFYSFLFPLRFVQESLA
jgi:hypothetical protein